VTIPLDHAALCADCAVLFDVVDGHGQCPKCAGEIGWMLLPLRIREVSVGALIELQLRAKREDEQKKRSREYRLDSVDAKNPSR
jgi:hypothetical protein